MLEYEYLYIYIYIVRIPYDLRVTDKLWPSRQTLLYTFKRELGTLFRPTGRIVFISFQFYSSVRTYTITLENLLKSMNSSTVYTVVNNENN